MPRPDSADSCAGTSVKPDNTKKQSIQTASIEKEIDAVMETWFTLKANKLTEIKVKYNAQVADLERQIDPTNPNDVMPMVIAQLRQSEAQELEDVTQEIDEKRREEVRKLRSRIAC